MTIALCDLFEINHVLILYMNFLLYYLLNYAVVVVNFT